MGVYTKNTIIERITKDYILSWMNGSKIRRWGVDEIEGLGFNEVDDN